MNQDEGTVPPLRYLTPNFAVAGELHPDDFAALARMGFRTVISNRPDGEEPGQLTRDEERELADAAGLAFHHVPAMKFDIFSEGVVGAMREAVGAAGTGPVVAHCKSGLRSALLWAITAAATRPIGEVIAEARAAGYDFSGMASEIAAASKL